MKNLQIEHLKNHCEHTINHNPSMFIKEEHITTLQVIEEREKLLDALKYFVRRVEEGSIRSSWTYDMYKQIIKEVEE
jgi:hypothetical protein